MYRISSDVLRLIQDVKHSRDHMYPHEWDVCFVLITLVYMVVYGESHFFPPHYRLFLFASTRSSDTADNVI